MLAYVRYLGAEIKEMQACTSRKRSHLLGGVMPGRLLVNQETRPFLPAYLKLRHDAGRGRWVLLAPERILTPDETAVAVLMLCDGKKTVEEISEALAKDYAAPVDVIREDVLELLQGLADKGYIKA